MGPPEEQVLLVDRDGVVTGSAPRSRMRAENLWHAATGVLVRDRAGRIYVHRRATTKDWCPSCHDAGAGGVLKVGEEPASSARRELAEELGITGVEVRPMMVGSYEDDTVRAVVHLFEASHDGPVVHVDGEVVWGAWMSLPELGAKLKEPAWPFVPDTRGLLGMLSREAVSDYALLGLNDDVAAGLRRIG